MMKILSCLAVVLIFCIGSPLFADEWKVIHAGKWIDVENGKVLQDQTIIIRGERIEKIVAGFERPMDGAQLIDLREYIVLPGLIDCHAHLIGDLGWEGGGALEHSEAQYAFTGARNAKTTLLAGFTTVRDIGAYRAFVDVALRNAINEGTVLGPRTAVCGAYITVSTGGGDLTGIAPDILLPQTMRAGIANDAAEIRRRVRELLNGGADFIKILATGAVLTRGSRPGIPEYTEAELRAAVEESDKYGVKVAAHAHGAEGIKNAIRAGVASIEHGSLIDEEGIQLMKQRGTYLVADIYNGDYISAEYRKLGFPEEFLRKNDETTEAQRKGFHRAVEVGVKIAYGTDSGVYPHGDNAKQFPYMVRYGMTPMGAIQSATIQAARLIGWENKVGSLSPGKYADIVAVKGDLLSDLSLLEKIPFVMKGGAIVKSPQSK